MYFEDKMAHETGKLEVGNNICNKVKSDFRE